jgi:ADP-ribosyl-[dinitrogen reductase] hydrolase
MAFLVAESIVEQRSLNMVDIAARLVAWGKDNPALGPSTGAGIAALARGTAWHEAGQTVVASSGCLPRCAPVACIVTEDRVVEDTIACCKPTHRHPLALAAAVAQNLILARLIRGLDWDQAFSLLDGAGSQLDEITSIRDALRRELAAPGAVDVLVEALRCVAHARDAEDALVASVALGGDTDTRAAVAGALAGARWGVSAFPRRWIDGCEAHDQARALGQSLAKFRLFEDQ